MSNSAIVAFTFSVLLVLLINSNIIYCRLNAANKVVIPVIQPYKCFSHYPGNSVIAMSDLNNDTDILSNYEISYAAFSNCGNDASFTIEQIINVMKARAN